MRKSISALLVACVVGCAAQQPYRDATDRGRTITDMQIDGAICQTVLPPSPSNSQSQPLCPLCTAIDTVSTKIKRQRVFDNCMKIHGWGATR
jgi:hypothetical protein